MEKTPDISTVVKLDNFVEIACPTIGLSANFFETFRDEGRLNFTEARVSPIYKTNKYGIQGLLKIPQWRLTCGGEEESKNVALVAMVLAPEKLVQMLKEISPTAAKSFLNDFMGCRIEKPKSKWEQEKWPSATVPKGALYDGYQFSEPKYHIASFKYVDPFIINSDNYAEQRDAYCKLLLSLTRRLSRMEQWVAVCVKNGFPKKRKPIAYEGNCTRPLALNNAGTVTKPKLG